MKTQENNPLEAAYAVLLENGLEGAGHEIGRPGLEHP